MLRSNTTPVNKLAPSQWFIRKARKHPSRVRPRRFTQPLVRRQVCYVLGLRRTAARGRSIQDILHNAPTQDAFLTDLRGFARSYQPPHFSAEEKTLVKLRAFFDAKLPR